MPHRNCAMPMLTFTPSGDLDSIGSGFLLRILNRIFLFSASHVFDDCGVGGIMYFGPDGKLATLEGHRYALEDSLYDVGVMEIASSHCCQLAARYSPFDSANLTPSLPPLGTLVQVTGYPAAHQTISGDERLILQPSQLSFYTVPARRPSLSMQGNFRPCHIALTMARNDIEGISNDVAPDFSPNGMSGSPVFGFFGTSPSMASPIGILTDHYPDKGVLRATRSELVLAIIRHTAPELASCLIPSQDISVQITDLAQQ